MTWHSKMTWPMTWLSSGTLFSPSGPPSAPVWPLIIAKPLQNLCKTRRGLDGGPVWPCLAPRLVANHCKTIAQPLQNHCKIVAKLDGGQTGADGDGPDGVLDGGLDGGPDGVADGGIIYF
jgi:hypothetical protein